MNQSLQLPAWAYWVMGAFLLGFLALRRLRAPQPRG